MSFSNYCMSTQMLKGYNSKQFNWQRATNTTTIETWQVSAKYFHTATSMIKLEYCTLAAARVLPTSHRPWHKAARNDHVGCNISQYHAVAFQRCNPLQWHISANRNHKLRKPLALRRLLLAVQLLQWLQFTDQCLVLILQQCNTILQTSHVVLLFPTTFFCCFSGTIQQLS